MDLTSITTIKSLCKQYGLYPSRERGQNFLINRDVLDDMIAAADLKKDDIVLEIGPGFGVLTLELAQRVKKVIAVEQDKILIKALQENLEKENIKNVEIIEGDILKIQDSGFSARGGSAFGGRIQDSGFRIVSNLPYQITSRFLRVFLSGESAETENKPQDMTIMVQKEVAERICAKPGDMSLLAVSVQFYGEPEIVRNVSKDCFWPEPKVDSAILRIALPPSLKLQPSADEVAFGRRSRRAKEVDEKYFFKIVRNGFLHRRQKLVNNLSNAFHLDKKNLELTLKEMGISENARAQELSMEQWIELSKQISAESKRA